MLLRTLVLLVLILVVTFFTPGRWVQGEAPPASLDIDGFPLALSPDGTSVAGVDREGTRFCTWDLATLEPACDGDLPAPVEARSVAWAPDGSAVAFSLGSSSRLVDSDIYVFDVAEGTLHNLTDDDPDRTGADAVNFLEPQAEPVAIDVFPTWSPDSATLLFARTMWKDAAEPGVTLMTIARDGGEPEVFVELDDVAPLAIASPMHWREDGSLILATRHPDPVDATNAIWLLDPDRTRSMLVDGSSDGPITDPVLAGISEDGASVSAWSRLDFHEGLWAEGTPIFFRVDIASGEATPWVAGPGTGLPDGARLLAPPDFGPDGAVAVLWRVRGGDMGVSVLGADGALQHVADVAYASGGPSPRNVNGLFPTIQWAENGTMLVILPTGGVIIPSGAQDATPIATPAG